MEKVLVVEDDHDILKMIDLTLTRFGYDVKAANGGVEGMEMLNSNSHFNLVITDICMPGLDGNQVAKYIRENDKTQDVPIIAISGSPDEVETKNFNSVLAKPFKMKRLIDLVDSYLY